MRFGWRASSTLAMLALPLFAAPAGAQNLTDEFIDRLLQAIRAEEVELEKVAPKLQEIDAKITKFEECRSMMMAAGEITDSKALSFAGKAAMRVKCGATSSEGFHKDKQKLLEGPEKVALGILKVKANEYGSIKESLGGYLDGRRDLYSAADLAVLDRRRNDLAAAFRVSVGPPPREGAGGGGGGRAGRGGRSYDFSSPNYAWEYIGNMFQVMYLSGAMVFEKPYQPGQWTRWQLTREYEVLEGDDQTHNEKAEFERAFLGLDPKGGEWWRTTQIDIYEDGEGGTTADTVVLEGLFKGQNEYVRQLVRMRGKFPGQAEPQELMVPAAFSMLSMLAVFPFAPTPESIEGATVGTDKVAGFDAKHVRFGGGDGNLEWWIADTAPGGWVRFRHTDPTAPDVKKPASYTMELVQHGSGAKSQLGVLK